MGHLVGHLGDTREILRILGNFGNTVNLEILGHLRFWGILGIWDTMNLGTRKL